MALKSLSEYYGKGKRKVGNRQLSEYYGDRGQGFTSASQIAAAFAANVSEYPRYFRRSFIVEKLRLSHAREISLLSDALYTLKKQGLIEYNENTNQWRNLSA